jgi:hypothetical protein
MVKMPVAVEQIQSPIYNAQIIGLLPCVSFVQQVFSTSPCRKNLLCCALCACVLSCSTNWPSAGGGTIETTNGVTAVIRYEDSSPAANAVVRMRFPDYLSPLGSGMQAIVMYDGVTDSTGRFTIDSVDVGD